MRAPPKKENPPLASRGGLQKVHCLAAKDKAEHTADEPILEGLAARWIARKARVSLPAARLVCDLAGIGGTHA